MPNSILQRLESIFSVWRDAASHFCVQAENYDSLIAVETLTPEEMRQLGHELIAMADKAQPDPSEAEMHDWRTHPALTPDQRGGA